MSKYNCKFKVGDIVYHKSNTKVNMLVTDIDDELNSDEEYNGIECRWISQKGELHEEDFLPIELELFSATELL